MLKKIIDCKDNMVTVNTNHVTLIEKSPEQNVGDTCIWVIADAGYTTKAIYVFGSVETITNILSEE